MEGKDDKNEKTYTQKDYDGVVAELTRVREEKRTLETKVTDLSARFDALESDKKKVESEQERLKLEGAGKYEEALKKVKEEYDASLERLTKQTGDLKGELSKYRIDNVIMGESSGKVLDGKAGQVVTLIKSDYRIAEKDDGTLEILTFDGKPVLDKTSGKALDLKGLTSQYLTDNPHLVKPTTAGGAGSQGTNQSGGKQTAPGVFTYDNTKT